MEIGRKGYLCSSSSHKFVGSEEESGWTKYLKDFSSPNDDHLREETSSFSKGISPSMVSDAASPSYHHHRATISDILALNTEEVNLAFSTISDHHFPKKLNVKQPRNKKYFLDHDLEDTASSPVSSPKVSGVKHTELDNGGMDDGSFLGKNSGSVPQLQSDEKGSIINVELASQVAVPFSIFPNYLG